MRVAILGAGSSGMFAAWAAIQWGCDVTVFDRDPNRNTASHNSAGVFALWDNCDLFLSQKRRVKVGIIGHKGLSKEDIEHMYAEKVYGDKWMESTSISKYMDFGYRDCYNHAEAYQQILDILGRDRIKEANFVESLESFKFLENYDLAFSTIPRDLFGEYPYTFSYIYHSKAPPEDSFMIYNVNEHIAWSRCSAIFGYFSMEYPEKPNDDKKYVRVKKVLPVPPPDIKYLGCPVILTGRFGAWKKDMLTEDVYYDVMRQLSDTAYGQSRRNVRIAEEAAIEVGAG